MAPPFPGTNVPGYWHCVLSGRGELDRPARPLDLVLKMTKVAFLFFFLVVNLAALVFTGAMAPYVELRFHILITVAALSALAALYGTRVVSSSLRRTNEAAFPGTMIRLAEIIQIVMTSLVMLGALMHFAAAVVYR